jgi:predicted Holliday junction resolvase-like endonuclease
MFTFLSEALQHDAVRSIVVIVLGVILSLCILGLFAYLFNRYFSRRMLGAITVDPEAVNSLYHRVENLTKENHRLQSALGEISLNMKNIPGAVLRSIQGDLNHMKGTVAEHISYLQLNSAYDRLLPFNSIVDFIGIKFPHGKNPGTLDFIDIKTGNARLSPEQSKLRKLIDNKQINFVVVKVTTDLPAAGEE